MSDRNKDSAQEPISDIGELSRRNEDFRREVITGSHCQVVLMTIPPGGEIGEEVHPDVDQILIFLDGNGEAVLDGTVMPVSENSLAFVRAGTRHNFRNTGTGVLRLVTVYAPPEHPAGTVHRTREEAEAEQH
jgi:mannose-6-phosphate isomerase-like protein (cupin superfamily)